MRIPLLITLPLLIVLLSLGWRNHRRIDALHSTQQKLTARTAKHGISLEPTTRNGGTRPTTRQRPDRVADAKAVAAGLVAYAAEPHHPDDRYSEATRLRVLAESERVMLLDGGQLKILIAELQAATDMNASMRIRFIRFAIKELIKSHPHDALAILLKSPDLELTGSSKYPPDSLFADAMRGWAGIDSEAAAAWFDKHRGGVPEKFLPHVETALISGAMINNPQLALQRFSESGRKPRDLTSIIGDNFHHPEGRLAFLAAFRQWSATLPDVGLDNRTQTSCLGALAFGKMSDRPIAFESTSRWLEQADLTPAELDRLTVMSFEQSVSSKDVGPWIEWLENSWPEKHAKRYQSHLLRGYSTSVPAAEWLMGQPDSPRRREMVGSCAIRAFDRDRETGIRLALSLPAGTERQSLLGGMYFHWPKDDPASQAAAEAFAIEHGLEK